MTKPLQKKETGSLVKNTGPSGNGLSQERLLSPLLGAPLSVVVMAKRAVPGQVKTRLIGSLSPQQAAQVHVAMLECVLGRVAKDLRDVPETRFVVALDEERSSDSGLPFCVPGPWQCVSQGTGDLGARMANVWTHAGGGPTLFLGVDSPDLPAELLESALRGMVEYDSVVGPVQDGGVWTIAARRYHPDLLRGIDWGTDRVYHQAQLAARQANLRHATLQTWYDVDKPDDLAKLRNRIVHTSDPDLGRLGDCLDGLQKGDKL